MYVAKVGYGKTRQQICNIAEMSAHNQGKVVDPTVSHGWFKRFLQRQTQLSYRRGDPTANVIPAKQSPNINFQVF